MVATSPLNWHRCLIGLAIVLASTLAIFALNRERELAEMKTKQDWVIHELDRINQRLWDLERRR